MAKKERKLSLARQFRAMDTKQRGFLRSLTEEERKEYSAFLGLKYLANVDGIPELQEYYLAAANQNVNRNYFDLGRHPELQWLLCTTVSPSMGTHNHYWLRTDTQRPRRRQYNFLAQLYPNLNEDELTLLLELNTDEDIVKTARDMGWDEKRIRDEL